MNIYLIERKGEIGYDEIDAQVVVANSPKEAKSIVDVADEGLKVWQSAFIKKISDYTGPLKKPHVILSSFNAG